MNQSQWQRHALDFLGLLVLALPLGVASLSVSLEGYLSDPHAQFLAKVLLALDRGRLEAIGFSYPPLPLLALLPWPSLYAPALWGALFVGGSGYLVLKDVWERRQPFLLAALVSLFASPIAVTLAVEDFSQAMGLFFLWAAWRQYVRWVDEGISVYGFSAGLLLGIAVYATPFALPLAVLFAAGFGFFRSSRLDAWVAGGLVLAFPALVGFAVWGYLAWLFTGKVAFLYEALRERTPLLTQVLLGTPTYIATGLVLLGRPRARLLLFLAPLVLLAGLPFLGFGYSLATGVTLLSLFALGAMPRRVVLWGKGLFVLAALLQAFWAWKALPWEAQVAPPVLVEQAIGKALGRAEPHRVLTDDRTAFRFVAWSGTARPFLLPADAGYGLALSAPALYVDYVLVCPGATPLFARYGKEGPKGFRLEWTFEGCRFYRKSQPPPLVPPLVLGEVYGR